VPQNLSETLNKRLRKIYSDISDSREVLSYASVIGYQFDVELLSSFLNKDKLKVYHVLQDVEERYGVVRQVANTTTFVFDHRNTQEVIYASLGQLAIDCHKKIAEFLENQHADNPFLVSFHYYRAKEWDAALQWLHRSAKTASESYFFSDAVKQYEQCFKLIQQKDIKMPESDLAILKLGYARSLLGSSCTSSCITNLNSLLAENLSEDQRVEALLLLGRCYRFEGSGDSGTKAIKSLEESLKIYEKINRYDRLAEVNSYLATVYDHFGLREKGIKCFEKSQICYNLTNDNIGIARLQRKSGIIYESRRAIDFMKNALDTFEKYSMKIEKARCLNNIGAESFYIGEFVMAEQYLASSIELFRTLDSPEVDIPLNNIGLVYQNKKEFAKALQFFEDANSNASEAFNEIFIKMNMANVFRQTGDLERAKQTIIHLEPLVVSYPENVLNDYYGYNRSRLHFDLEEFDQAEEWLLKFPANNYKEDNELVMAKRLSLLALIYEKKRKPYEEARQKSLEFFKTARPQKWFYELDYYPCDIHIWD
jgi:tetratricopeptide (TPR) repeat protein